MNIYDIAKKANVSIATVSRVMNNKPNVSEQSRNKVLSVLSDNNYMPSAIAKGLVHNTSNYVSIIIEDIRHSHYTSIAYFLEQSIKSLGYNCIISNCKATEIDSILPSVITQRPRGIVIIGSIFSNRLTEQAINSLVKDLPIIMINGYLNCPNVTSIFPDDGGGISLAVNYLFDKGHRNIYFIRDNTTWSSDRKLEGYRTSMRSLGLEGNLQILETTNTLEGGVAVGRKIIDHYYAPGQKIALVFSEDVTASGCLQELLRSGIQVPEEIALIGYDNSEICRFSNPNITSIDSRPDVVGNEAARVLDSMSVNGTPDFKNIVVSPVLVNRGTT